MEAAERVLGEWVRGWDALGHVALDGERLRGSAPAFASHLGGVIGQLQVEPDGNEITAALALLEGLPLRGAVITGDAVFCQRAICRAVRDVKGEPCSPSKPTSRPWWPVSPSRSATLFPPELVKASGGAPPPHDRTPPPDLALSTPAVEKGHGRIERVRERAGTISHEIAYAVTSLSPEQADPDTLLALWRDHPLIKNRLHWRRDVILSDDRRSIRSGTGPRALAALRSTLLDIGRDAAKHLPEIRETFAEHRLEAIAVPRRSAL